MPVHAGNPAYSPIVSKLSAAQRGEAHHLFTKAGARAHYFTELASPGPI